MLVKAVLKDETQVRVLGFFAETFQSPKET